MGTPKTQALGLGLYRQDGGKCPDRRRRVAGAGGFEPPHGGIKIHCLTAWRRPNARPSPDSPCRRADLKAGIALPQLPWERFPVSRKTSPPIKIVDVAH